MEAIAHVKLKPMAAQRSITGTKAAAAARRPTLRSLLADMPSPTNPGYEAAKDKLIASKRLARAELRRLIRDKKPEIAYNALELELTLLGRDREFDRYRDLVAASRARFGSEPRFITLSAQASRWSDDERVLLNGLAEAREGMKRLPDSAAMLNTFGAIVVTLAEMGRAEEHWLTEAEGALIHAADLNPTYPKYHHHLASVLQYQKRWDEALKAVGRAIELERADSEHYALRIGDYQNTRMEVISDMRLEKMQQDVRRQQESVTEAVSAIKSEFASMRTEVMLLVGLLAAIVGFIVTGVQVASQGSLSHAAALMIVIATAILAVFAGFRLIFLTGENDQAHVRRSYVIIGCCLAIIGLIWGLAA